MGYETFHFLSVYDKNLNKIDEDAYKEEIELLYDEQFYNWTKWYDCDENMKEYSKKYPDIIFCIEGEGEENADLWINYYKNGKMQHCEARIEYDYYDPNKLE